MSRFTTLRAGRVTASLSALLTLASIAPISAHPGHEGNTASDPLSWALAEGQAVREPILLAQAEGGTPTRQNRKERPGALQVSRALHQ